MGGDIRTVLDHDVLESESKTGSGVHESVSVSVWVLQDLKSCLNAKSRRVLQDRVQPGASTPYEFS